MLPVYARAKVCDCRGESASKRNGISFVRNRVGADDLECLSGKYVPDVAIKQRVNHHAAGGREAGELKTARGRNQRLARRSDIVENDRSTSRVGGYVWQRDADFAVLVRTKCGASISPATLLTHCSLSMSGPTTTGLGTLASIQHATEGAE
jgi:hypothetical protein